MSTIPEGADTVLTCDGCGATVYREHLDRGLAGRTSGKLFCPHCMAEKRRPPGAPAGHQGDLETLARADEGEAGGGRPARSGSVTGFAMLDPDTHGYQRALNPAGRGATRMRIFHCKLSDGPVGNLNQQVNEWLDQHPDIEIKFANTTIGTWEGKHSEQHIILTLYY